MRNFKEYKAKFYEGVDQITGEDKYLYGHRIVLDLNSVVSFNDNSEPGYLTVTMSNGECYAIVEDFEAFKALIMKSALVAQSSMQ
jgi:hypothetical protein